LTQFGNTVSVMILFVVMGVIYIKSDLIYLSPVINFFGLNIFKVFIKAEEEEYVLITKKEKRHRKTCKTESS
jgi:hypothetical protein